jgi:hypothetical protein
MDCLNCNKKLSGRQEKFCSNICKCHYNNHNANDGKGFGSSYPKQKERGLKRKLEFIEMKGGKCKLCGYNKCIASLTFHHIDPSTKEFLLDMRSLSNRTYNKCLVELDKCELLCFNCHMELHFNEE